MKALWIKYIALVLAYAAASSAHSANFSGKIASPTGVPIAGAMVTLFNQQSTRKITVYSAADGTYQLNSGFAGELKIRVRSSFYDDLTATYSVAVDQYVEYSPQLTVLKTVQSASDALPASAHVATLQWQGEEHAKEAFISQCNFCHQMGNALTRTPRSREAWRATIRRMEGHLAILTDDEADTIADTLHEDFDGKPVSAHLGYEYHPGLASASVEEWLVGDGMSFIHDADIGSNGLFYGADEGHDIIWELDPVSGEVNQYPLPDIDLPVGGKFSGMELPIGVFTGKHGPHSFAEDEEGKLWITNSLSSHLISFDIHSKQFASYDIGGDSLYLHTIRIDAEGIIWFTIAASNQVGRFDPVTKTSTLIDLPSNGWHRWLTDALFPYLLKLAARFPDWDIYPDLSHHKMLNQGRSILNMPYGIDVNPVDGKIWYAKLEAHKLGVIDPDTLQIKEIDTPLKGPRRPRFDSNGILWIPAFEESALMRFDPTTEQFVVYPMPVLADNQWETPYALNVHPQTNDIWITSNNSDRIFRFNQSSEEFVAYPSPTQVTFLRDLVFSKEGKVCSSQSNLPAYGIEGGRPSFICLDPNGVLPE